MAPRPQGPSQPSIRAASALMAAGTVVSRITGFVRSALLAAALGASLHADIFNIANTVPNMAYILLAGGIFNAVLVPQLVRAMKAHDDAGEAYTNRIITLAALFLGAVTLLLVVAAPWVMRLFLSSQFYQPDHADELASVVAFARLCLPQVFFYGMFVLVGQVLNARGSFGPMMWAPIANNIIAVVILVVYLAWFGPATGAELNSGYTTAQEWWLGAGSTLGIVVQFAILLPYLRGTGFVYTPRFDFRGTGLGHTGRLAGWTVGSVLVSQIAYTIVVHLASAGTFNHPEGTGYSVYSQTYLIMVVPHSVVTVSLATAMLPRLSALAADRHFATFSRTLMGSARSALAIVVPFALLLPVLAGDISEVLWGHGAVGDESRRFVPSLALFGPALIVFTTQFLLVRGLFALEATRTAFWVQSAVAAANIALAFLFVSRANPLDTAPALVVAFGGSYLVGTVVAWLMLRARVGSLGGRGLLRFGVRLGVIVLVAAAAAQTTSLLLVNVIDAAGWFDAFVRGSIVGLVYLVVLLAMARALRFAEINDNLHALVTRLRGSRGSRG